MSRIDAPRAPVSPARVEGPETPVPAAAPNLPPPPVSSFDATPVPVQNNPSLTAEVNPANITWERVHKGQLFIDGLSWDDVTQGAVGNCYLLSALTSVASSDPAAMEQLIRHVGRGEYEVRFFEKTRSGPKEVRVRVTGELPMEDGALVYAAARNKRELWVSLVEKAFAVWQGDYDVINQGGFTEDTIYALTGRKSDYVGDLQRARASRVWTMLTEATREGRPMTAGTWSQDDFESDYEAVGLVEGHAYSLLRVNDEGGVRTVTLRNPWGSQEFGSDGRDDGVFTMTFDDFRTYFGDLTIARPAA